jgi:hypothetical protein
MSKPDAADCYASWAESTPTEDFPQGDDLTDLAAIGETRYSDVSADELARRVTVARQHGRDWWQIAQYLGMTERQARTAYGTPAERRHEDGPGLVHAVRDVMNAVREALRGDLAAVRDHSQR